MDNEKLKEQLLMGTKKEILDICREEKASGYSKKNKKLLIDWLVEKDVVNRGVLEKYASKISQRSRSKKVLKSKPLTPHIYGLSSVVGLLLTLLTYTCSETEDQDRGALTNALKVNTSKTHSVLSFLHGVVEDKSGNPMPRAKISVLGHEAKAVLSDKFGHFKIASSTTKKERVKITASKGAMSYSSYFYPGETIRIILAEE